MNFFLQSVFTLVKSSDKKKIFKEVLKKVYFKIIKLTNSEFVLSIRFEQRTDSLHVERRVGRLIHCRRRIQVNFFHFFRPVGQVERGCIQFIF